MDHNDIIPDEAAAVAALNKEMADSIAEAEESEGIPLPDLASAAATETSADAFDIGAAAKLAEDVDPAETAKLKQELSGCGSALRSAKKQERKSRDNYHLALAHAHLVGTAALQSPAALVALAKKKKIPTTKASWKNPHLVLLKLIDPTVDDKTASMCARALNYVSAAGVPPDQAASFIGRHGVVALAREEAKRQKLRKSGGDKEPLAEDPLTALRREASPVPFPTGFDVEGMPQNDGEASLMIVDRRDGKLFAWAVDADEKSISAAARRVLKQIRAAGAAEKKEPEAA